jgi:hypothetical protein
LTIKESSLSTLFTNWSWQTPMFYGQSLQVFAMVIFF